MGVVNRQPLMGDSYEQDDKHIIKRKQDIDILIIEGEPITAGFLHNKLSEMRFHTVSVVPTVEAAWKEMWHNKPDLVLMNRNMEKKLNGVNAADAIHRQYDIPIIYIGSWETETNLPGNDTGHVSGSIRKPIQVKDLELEIRMALYKHELESELYKKDEKYRAILEKAIHDFTGAICCALEYRDSYTAGHQKRVAELALLIGKRIGLNEDQLQELYIGGMLHDIGKIGVPMDILAKSTCLTEMEFMLVKNHVQIGFDILKDINFPWSIKGIVLNHHEMLDGSGYPNGISGDKINRSVRIITVCDIVEAMSTMRPYRAARSSIEVINELRAGKGVKYDEGIVEAVIDLIETEVYNPWGVSSTV